MSIDRNNFIIKRNRKYFKAACDQCGEDRGYKTPDHANRPCCTCNTKKANLVSQIVRGGKLCSIENCGDKHVGSGFCQKHYERHRRPSTVGKEVACQTCGASFIKTSGMQKYCNNLCNVRAYYNRNKDEINEKRANNPNASLYRKQYTDKNKKKLNKNAIHRRTVDINYKLSSNLRSRLSKAIGRNQKTCSAVRDLGCSLEDFKEHLKSKWQLGMTWSNYGKNGWHIDHIVPISRFDLENPEELKKACHYTNLQPLWWRDNIVKGARYEL